jgi:hypothetical protein
MGEVIGSIVCSPASPRVGESALVEVLNSQGERVRDSEPFGLTIDGVPATAVWLRWTTPGSRFVQIAARDPETGLPELKRVVVEVQPLGTGEAPLPHLHADRIPDQPTALKFSLVDPNSDLRPLTNFGPRVDDESFRRAVRRQTRRSFSATVGPTLVRLDRSATYEWDFGDGTQLGTAAPVARHDFGPRLSPGRERVLFNVRVRRESPPDRPLELHHSVCVLNTYAMMRKRGLSRPPVHCEPNAFFHDGKFKGKFSVRNPETFPLRLTRRLIELFFDDDERGSVLLKSEPVSYLLPADTTTELVVAVDAHTVPKTAIGFAVHFAGRPQIEAIRLRVRVSAYFDIIGRRSSGKLSASLSAYFNTLVRDKLVPHRSSIRISEIESLLRRGIIKPPRVADPSSMPSSLARLVDFARAPGDPPKALSGHMEEGPPMVGAECHPENLPDEVPEGFVCQATNEERWELLPGRFMNAKKGSIVLSPGDTGYIAQMMLQVDPPQHYSHCAVMTRNHDEITSSTASPERLKAHPAGNSEAPVDGHEPFYLKYQWPGAITQRVHDAVEGEWIKSPGDEVDQESYFLKTFNPDVGAGGVTNLTPALVVKPDEFLVTPELQDKLKQVAKLALGEVGRTHYSFYAYTNPAAALGTEHNAPIQSNMPVTWPDGTYPTQCASFVWLCARQVAGFLEGDSETGQEAGAVDGLYHYTAEERRAAGNWLYGTIRNEVKKAANDGGWFAQFGAEFEDVADDVANQILNTFDTNWADGDSKDSDAWKNTGDAFSVSPDDILNWDAPTSVGGLYGDAEELMYRPEHLEKVTVHRWAFVETFGNVVGTTTLNGSPIAGTRVELDENTFAITDQGGRFTLSHVRSGPYELQAYVVVEMSNTQMPLSAKKKVNVIANGTIELQVELSLPNQLYREVVVAGCLHTIDDEFAAAANPQSFKDFSGVFHVGPGHTHEEETFTDVADDSVMSQVKIAIDAKQDGSVNVTATGRIYESENPADGVGDQTTGTFEVPRNGYGLWGVKLINSDDDSVEINFEVSNNLDKF